MEEVNSVISFRRNQIDGLLEEVEAAMVDVYDQIDVIAGVVNGKRVNVGMSQRLFFFVFFFVRSYRCFSIYGSQNSGGSRPPPLVATLLFSSEQMTGVLMTVENVFIFSKTTSYAGNCRTPFRTSLSPIHISPLHKLCT